MTKEQIKIQQVRRLAKKADFYVHKLRGVDRYVIFSVGQFGDISFSLKVMTLAETQEALQDILDGIED